MRILHQCAWTKTEMDNFHSIIVENVWEGLKTVALHMKQNDITVSSSSLKQPFLGQRLKFG